MVSKLNFGNNSNTLKGQYVLKNPAKYVGSLPVIYRSSWELKMMVYFDTHPYVLRWASETIKIPYINPFTQKINNYYPDFFVEYIDKTGKQTREIIEIKPAKEAILEKAKSKKDKLSYALNIYKWASAKKFCKDNNMVFRVVTENELFGKK